MFDAHPVPEEAVEASAVDGNNEIPLAPCFRKSAPLGVNWISPESVERVPITPYERKMFPYLDRWSKGYFVVFPKADIGGRFELRLESVAGGSTLKFDVD